MTRLRTKPARTWLADKSVEIRRVLIIESTRADELYRNKREGVLLGDLLRLLGIRSTYRVCVDRKRLENALAESSRGEYDAVHVSCHGDSSGLALTNAANVDWDELVSMSRGHLQRKLLVLSACESGARELADAFARTTNGPGIIVGTKSDIDWDDAAIAWQLLYKWLREGHRIGDALQRVAVALDVRLVYRRWVSDEYRPQSFPRPSSSLHRTTARVATSA